MDEQDINIRIAQFMGWDESEHVYNSFFEHERFGNSAPDYCHDLNAVWEVEERLILTGEGWQQVGYASRLMEILGIPHGSPMNCGNIIKLAHASALDRCRAIIKVLEG
jgi:hypothetical protein